MQDGDDISEENVAIVLLNSLPSLFADVKTVIKYSHQNLVLYHVKSALRTKSLDLKKENRSNCETSMLGVDLRRRNIFIIKTYLKVWESLSLKNLEKRVEAK